MRVNFGIVTRARRPDPKHHRNISSVVTIVLDNLETPMRTLYQDIQSIALGLPYDLAFSGDLIALPPVQEAPLLGQYQM